MTATDDRGPQAPVPAPTPASAPASAPAPAPGRVPVQRLTVLYDPDCSLCTFVRNWLVRQRQLVPLDLVPVASEEARRRFPELDHAATLREITLIGDSGQVYQGPAAWVVCLWALAEYRPMSHRFSSPTGAPLAKAAVLAAAKYREAAKGWAPYPAGPARAGVPVAQAASGSKGQGVRIVGPDGGWVYDPARGWTVLPPVPGPGTGADPGPDACADGCSVPD